MKNVTYESPKMIFVDLHNENAIATTADMAPCMSQAAHGHRNFYFDAPGDGWVEIIANNENCNGQATFSYVDNEAIDGVVSIEKQNDAIAKAKAALNADKQQFSGAIVDKPDPKWS